MLAALLFLLVTSACTAQDTALNTNQSTQTYSISATGIQFPNSMAAESVEMAMNHLRSQFAALLTSNRNLQSSKRLVPPLIAGAHKGQAGRILVIGGSYEYTGAPYYAAMSALKTGADLSTVACSVDAGIPIKAYSPELIVYPVLPSKRRTEGDEDMDTLLSLVERSDAVVVGPGLGREEFMFDVLKAVFSRIKNTPIVLDGDALFTLAKHNELLHTHRPRHAILTPNGMEFKRLWVAAHEGFTSDADISKVLERFPIPEVNGNALQQLAEKLGDVIIVKKGGSDFVIDQSAGKAAMLDHVSPDMGAPRRCGGQGDILAGAIATFAAWARKSGGSEGVGYGHAALGAAYLVRGAAQLAFAEHKRSMTAPDILSHIGGAFNVMFEE